jgi:hypothetical protein
LNRPGYVYLLWIDGQGHIDPLYPWGRDFRSRPATETPQGTIHSPPELDRGWPLEGPSGLETAVLLAGSKPLPPEVNLAKILASLPPAPMRDPLEFAERGFDSGQPVDAIRVGVHRGLGQESEEIDEPLLKLLEKLRRYFDVVRVTRFAYRGE